MLMLDWLDVKSNVNKHQILCVTLLVLKLEG